MINPGQYVLASEQITVALTAGQVLDAKALWSSAGAIDPTSMLWLPDEPQIVLPEKELILLERPTGVSVYRLSTKRGTFWYDEGFGFVDAFDPHGKPMALFDGDGNAPDVEKWRRLVKAGWWYGHQTHLDREVLVRWPDLLTVPERTVVAQIRLEQRRGVPQVRRR